MICPRCQAENREDAVLCANCGYNFTRPEEDSAEMALTDYTPGNLLMRLAQARVLAENPRNVPVVVDNLSQEAQLAYLNGDYDETIALSDEAYRLSHTIGYRWGKAASRFLAIYMCYMDRGEIGKATATIKDAITHAAESGHLTADILMSADLGWMYSYLGALEQARPLIEHACEIAMQQFPSLIPWTSARLARLHLVSGNLTAADNAVRLAHEHMSRETLMLPTLVLVPIVEADIAVARKDYTEAHKIVDALINRLYHVQMRPYTPKVQYLKTEILLAEGKFDEARKINLKARAGAEALGMQRLMWEVLYSLSQIDAWRGERESAATWKQQARRICLQIADSIGDPELRATFVSQGRVRRVFDGN